MVMRYIKHVVHLEDKLRLFAIIGLAVTVLLLMFTNPHTTHVPTNTDTHKHHTKTH